MAETISRKSVIYDIIYNFQEGNRKAEEASKKIKGLDAGVASLGNTLKTIGGLIASAFTIQKISQFTQEAIKLAGAAEGVQAAFSRLNSPNLLNELRRATRGTVSDLELMKAAVRAENFQVPLQKLGTFFEFARQRAAATGQSVDFLVNSIIDGIGRKSTLVLDNLGISASKLQEEIKKTGDFGQAAANIIEQEMTKAGGSVETTAESFARLNSNIENFKVEIGGAILASGIFRKNLDNIADIIEQFTTGLKIKEFANEIKLVEDTFGNLFSKQTKDALINSFRETGGSIDVLKEKFPDLTTEFGKLVTAIENYRLIKTPNEALIGDAKDISALDKLAKKIKILEENRIPGFSKELEKAKKLYDSLVFSIARSVLGLDAVVPVRNIEFLNAEIEKYENLIKTTGTATVDSRRKTTEYSEAIRNLKEEIEEIIKPVEKLSEVSITSADAQVISQGKIQDSIDETIKKYGELANKIDVTVPKTKGIYGDVIVKLEEYQTAVSDVNSVVSSFADINALAYQTDAANLKKALDEKRITQEQYDKSIANLQKQKIQDDAAIALTKIAIEGGIATALAITKALNDPSNINVISAIASALAVIATITSTITSAKAQVQAVGYAEGTEFLDNPKAKIGKDTIPVMGNRGEAIIPTDKNLSEPGLAKAWIDGDLDKYIYRNYVMPEMMRSTSKGKSEKDYSEKFYRQYLATQEQTAKQVSLLKSIDSKLKGGQAYASRYGRT